MTTNLLPPKGYFDATKLLAELPNKPRGVKVSQFLDNANIKNVLNTLDKPLISEPGRYGYTFLKDELLQEYQEWLKSVGSKALHDSKRSL